MTFDPSQHARSSDGRFTEKTGAPSEISLDAPQSRRARREAQVQTDTFVLPRGTVKKNEMLTASDISRIRDYLDRKDIVFAENGKKTSDLDTGEVTLGKHGTADQAIADLVVAARSHERDDRFNEEEYETARELFGDEYEAIVNPKRTFWEQFRGF